MKAHIGAAARQALGPLGLIGIFSVFFNLLMLTGPLFMLQVYDRVLTSRSEATLTALLVLVAGLYLAMGLLDFVRGRICARIGARFQAELDARVFSAALRAPPSAADQAVSALSDLDAVRKFFAAPVAFAIFDMPFAPLFMFAIFVFNPWLGILAVASAALLIFVMLLNQLASRRLGTTVGRASAGAARLAEQIRTQPETIHGLGMAPAAIRKWQAAHDKALEAEMSLSDRNGSFGAVSKALRLFLQSAMLALGAWLVLQNQLTAGMMIAGSILLGRALAPIEQLIGGWAILTRARAGLASLRILLRAAPVMPPKTALGNPRARLSVENVAIVPPGAARPILQNISFDLAPGEALAIVGESAVGKTSLARLIAGWWKPATGQVRLDGAALDQFDDETLSGHIGYLPQELVFFDGTVAENIARLRPDATSEMVVDAARRAGAHEMILRLPQGYDTELRAGSMQLSGGQKQRLGLARAMFGDPVVLILDEPNSNLDAGGSDIVNEAIRRMKAADRAVIVIAHRPSAVVECDTMMMLKDGRVAAFGPRDEVLRQNVQTAANVATLTAQGRAR